MAMSDLSASLLPVATRPTPLVQRIRDNLHTQALLISTAGFISVLNLINAASFGLLILTPMAGLQPTIGVPIFLISTLVQQIALSCLSGASFACGGATIELVPLLRPISALVAGAATNAEKESTLLAMFSCTSVLIGGSYICISRLRFGRLFRCIRECLNAGLPEYHQKQPCSPIPRV